MPVIKQNNIEFKDVTMDGVIGVAKAKVIGSDEGWKSHCMRVFRVTGGGHTPRHQHEWEHVNYVINGAGRLRIGETVHDLNAGDFAFVPPGIDHQFENPYDDDFEFICIVPAAYA